MLLGEIIYAYRQEHRLSQRQFAEKCGGLSHGYISMLENNNNPCTSKPIAPSLDKLIRIAAGLSIPLNELISKAEDLSNDLLPANPIGEEDPSPDQLTAEESKFLSIFSRLSPENQKLLLASAAVFLQAQGESPDPPV